MLHEKMRNYDLTGQTLACVAGGFRGWGRGVWGHRKSGQGEKVGGIKRAKRGGERKGFSSRLPPSPA